MSNVTLNPYLFFTGNCREAMEFYQTVFGGKLDIQNVDDMPGMAAKPGMEGLVMHAALTGGTINLMASDGTRDKYDVSFISLSLNSPDEEVLRTLFDKLAEGGTVVSPMKKEVWGAVFGQLTDKFGVDWMVNVA